MGANEQQFCVILGCMCSTFWLDTTKLKETNYAKPPILLEKLEYSSSVTFRAFFSSHLLHSRTFYILIWRLKMPKWPTLNVIEKAILSWKSSRGPFFSCVTYKGSNRRRSFFLLLFCSEENKINPTWKSSGVIFCRKKPFAHQWGGKKYPTPTSMPTCWKSNGVPLLRIGVLLSLSPFQLLKVWKGGLPSWEASSPLALCLFYNGLLAFLYERDQSNLVNKLISDCKSSNQGQTLPKTVSKCHLINHYIISIYLEYWLIFSKVIHLLIMRVELTWIIM